MQQNTYECRNLLNLKYSIVLSDGGGGEREKYNVTDFIKALPGNSSVNTVQHPTVEEAVFSMR
jgi:hypothetical protein